MPTSRTITLLVALGLAVSGGLARALDEAQAPSSGGAPLAIFKDPQQAMSLDGRAGEGRSALDALRYAADGGQPLARWRLGSMYASGEGVPHDDRAAYKYFRQVVDAYDESDPDPRERSVVAAAFVAVGAYCLTGVPGATEVDAERARALFAYAATEFGDPNAQYNLGRMYLEGEGAPKDARRGARWLRLAADKQHMASQALLGHVYFAGQDGVPRQRALGLMYLTLARDAAGERPDARWVVDLYDAATAAATEADKTVAALDLAQFQKSSR